MTLRFLALLASSVSLLFHFAAGAADDLPVPQPAKPQNGVFMLAMGYSSTVLELKDGRFRYWFETDVVSGKEPQYPLAGEYVVTGDTITLKHDQIHDAIWTFRTVKDTLTLWRAAAVSYYNDKKRFDPYGILRLTDEPAEKAWEHRMEKFLKQ